MTIVQIDGNMVWRCFRASGGNWVGVCDPLALTIQSETWATLMEDISQTLNAILKDLLESHELEKFLKDRGWHLVGPVPSRTAADDVSFDIPFLPRIADHDSQGALH